MKSDIFDVADDCNVPVISKLSLSGLHRVIGELDLRFVDGHNDIIVLEKTPLTRKLQRPLLDGVMIDTSLLWLVGH